MVWLSGLLPYTQVVEVFARIGHQEVARTSVWERTQAHGERMQRHVAHQREQVAPERVVLPGPGQDHRQVKGVSLDGGMMHIRGEGWKEFKVGTVFDVVLQPGSDPHTGEAVEQPCAVNIGYTAVLGDVAHFGPALWKLAVDKDVPRAARSGVTADGAAWIWNLAADYFPDSVQIVDWYHADEHLAAAAHALYPDNEAQAARWRHQMHTPLFLGEAWKIAQTLQHAGLGEHATYFATHQRRMQYQDFREEGFPIGSGTVESGCKQFKARLTGPGMQWTRAGADRMLVIRAAVMERSFDRLWALAA